MSDLYSLLKQFNAIGGIAQTGQPGFCLLMALWQKANELNWANRFTMTNAELLYKAGFKCEKTLIEVRNKLAQLGYFKYIRPKNRRQCGTYILEYDLLKLINDYLPEYLPDVSSVVSSEVSSDVNSGVSSEVSSEVNINKQNKTKQNKNNIYADFVNWYNSQFGTKHKVSIYREKLKTRLKTFSIDQLKTAAVNMHNDPYMTGQNKTGRVYATLEYLLRNDKNVDKWLVQKPRADPEQKESKYEDVYLT